MYCPYCFSTLQTRTMVCKNKSCALYDNSMPVRAERLRTRLPRRLRVRGGVLLADRVTKCDSCGLPCNAVCDSCGREIASTWLRYPSANILFLGVNGVGKSTLLATSKLALSQRNDVTMTPLDVEDTAERFYDSYSAPMLERGESVAHTVAEVPRPFLWGVTGKKRTPGAQTLALAVYDVPGEMLLRHAETQAVEPLLARADAAVLAINPAALPALNAACGAAAGVQVAPDAWERAERILDELLKRRSIGLKSDVKLSVVFTHADLWFSELPDINSNRALNDPLLRELAQHWRGGAFISRLSEFNNCRLFATGLYKGSEVRPLDGADAPLLYLIDRLGLHVNARG